QGRLDLEQQADGVDSAIDDEDVDGPKEEEAQELGQVDGEVGMRREIFPARQVHFEDLVDGPAADPRLDAEPPAGDEGAEQGGDVGAANAEGRAAVHGK